MINHFFENYNIDSIYMCVVGIFLSIKEIYDQMLLYALGNRVIRIGCPKCGKECMDFTIHGSYLRNVIDLVAQKDENGNTLFGKNGEAIFQDYQAEKLKMKITRIKCKDDGSTHALLFNLVVPYGQYSLRYIVYHLHKMIHSEDSMEGYCDKHGIDVDDMQKWIKWLEENAPLLQQANLIPENDEMAKDDSAENGEDIAHSDNRRMKNISFLKIIIDYLYNEFKTFYKASLAFLGRVMFQRHKNPTNTMHQFP
jgi:hypothetical protein